MARLPSTVEIIYDGTTDVTANVLPAESNFESLMNAMAGSFQMVLKDPAQTLSFVTGKELVCKIDGVEMFGGFLTSVTCGFFFPVVNTRTRLPSAVKERKWTLRGVDFNVLFDRRVLRNPADYLHQLPNFSRGTMDGALIREALVDSKYFDIDPAFDVETFVDDVIPPFDPLNDGDSGEGAWQQQGSTLRSFMEDLVQFSGAVYYFGADKTLRHKALEDVEARWGFSDLPNKNALTGAAGYQGATYGFRDIDATEDGAVIVDDALIWGGSEWSGSGQTVFAREENTDAITEHGRWQTGEVHLGEEGFKLQGGVDARANVIVNGDPGSVGGDANRGLRFPQWTVALSWFAHDVPKLSGVREHLKAGDLVRIILATFAVDDVPLELVLPLRSLRISFPGQPSDGEATAWVKFEGTFGLQLSDPYTLWRYLLGMRKASKSIVSSVDGSNPAPYGSLLSIEPTPSTDGIETVFDLPDDRGYIAGTTEVYVEGVRMRLGVDYSESDPNAGEITFYTAPTSGDWIWVICRVTGG